jgi:hypothetical protein
MKGVVIRGDGIAACCCAHLLATAGIRVAMEKAERTSVPAVLLSARTQALIGDVFGRRDLFAGLPRIEKRSVAWGRGSESLVLAHSSVIVSEGELAERLRPSGLVDGPESEWDPRWTILASRPLPTSRVERRFGSRMASALRVELARGIDSSTCWIESLECGWLFLIPSGDNAGWLLAVGGAHELLLAQSRIVAQLIESVRSNAGQFPAYPRIGDPLCGPGWLACGSAALAFDPLCGDGAGNAVREAILAAAIIRAEANGAHEQDVLAHYRGRLLAGFRKHLELCQQFYAAGHSGSWWNTELDFLQEGIEWCARQMNDSKPFQYRLSGFELHVISG